MTNERAIELLRRLQDEQFDGQHGDERREALEMAVRALEGDGDTISRQQAIDEIMSLIEEPDDDFNEGVRTSASVIYQLPSAQSQWIPCRERLPHGSCSDLVNVSIHDDSGDTPFDYTSCGWVTTDGEYWIVDNEINNHVIAWMPLPTPYGGDAK